FQICPPNRIAREYPGTQRCIRPQTCARTGKANNSSPCSPRKFRTASAQTKLATAPSHSSACKLPCAASLRPAPEPSPRACQTTPPGPAASPPVPLWTLARPRPSPNSPRKTKTQFASSVSSSASFFFRRKSVQIIQSNLQKRYIRLLTFSPISGKLLFARPHVWKSPNNSCRGKIFRAPTESGLFLYL